MTNDPTPNDNIIDDLHEERGERYGDWTSQAEVAQAIKQSFTLGDSYQGASSQVKEKLDMIANKISRIVNGDPYWADSWNDIAGYATLPNRDLTEKQSATPFLDLAFDQSIANTDGDETKLEALVKKHFES